jgi:hypothetical protein
MCVAAIGIRRIGLFGLGYGRLGGVFVAAARMVAGSFIRVIAHKVDF